MYYIRVLGMELLEVWLFCVVVFRVKRLTVY